MANVTVNGVPYTGVEDVYLPKTGGGEERFTLPPSGTLPITANGTADVSAYQYANVNVPTGADTSDATATASDIVGGKTAYIASGKTTGTMTSKSAQTYTPGTSDQTINAGQYLAGAQTIKGDANLVAGNIKNGVSIFGVAGSYSGGGGTTVQIRTGSVVTGSGGNTSTVNVGFDADVIILKSTVSYTEYGKTCNNSIGINMNDPNFDGQYGSPFLTYEGTYSSSSTGSYMLFGGYVVKASQGFSLKYVFNQDFSGSFSYLNGRTINWTAIKYT